MGAGTFSGIPSRFMIYAVSGCGNRAGKSTLAATLSSNVWSIASALKLELSKEYPQYNWFDKDGRYKDATLIKELSNKSMRQVMVEYGQTKSTEDPAYWIRRLCEELKKHNDYAMGFTNVAIDDVRKSVELKTLRESFPGSVRHFHVISSVGIHEPEFENEYLERIADYTVRWESK